MNLQQALNQMCAGEISSQKEETLNYTVCSEMPMQVVSEAAMKLKEWGVRLPEKIEIMFSDDVNCHMCRVEDLTSGSVY